MDINIRVSASELEPWLPRVHRQLNLNLSSLRENVRTVDVRLDKEQGNPVARITCRMQALLQDERQVMVDTNGSNPNICIADAAARLARTVGRDLYRLHSPSTVSH